MQMPRPDNFTETLNEMNGSPVSEQDSADAFRNLTGFLGVLLAVNQRIGLVALDDAPKAGKGHEHAAH